MDAVPYGWSMVDLVEPAPRTVDCDVCGVAVNEWLDELDDRGRPFHCCLKCLVEEV